MFRPSISLGFAAVFLAARLAGFTAPDAAVAGTVPAEPTWTSTNPIFDPVPGTTSVKDASIVYFQGKYHVFFTVYVTPKKLEIHYASAAKLAELNQAPRVRVMAGFAPQVFFFQDRWYLVHHPLQYSTNSILGPAGWENHGKLCANVPEFPASDPHGPLDPWVICDETTAYLFYSRDNGTLNLTSQPLRVFPSPSQWSPHTVVLDERPSKINIFEAAHIYRSRRDGRYYLQVEGLGNQARKLALYSSPTLRGPWTLVSHQWAAAPRLKFPGGTGWTEVISHPEAIRANYTQTMEVDDINRSYWLYMGITRREIKAAGSYGAIPWHLGVMHNGEGPLFPPSPAN